MYGIQDYARRAAISPRAVRLRIERGVLPAEKVGGIWVISEDDGWEPRQRSGRRLSSGSFDLLADLLDGDTLRMSPDEKRRAAQRARRIAEHGLSQVREFGRRPDLDVKHLHASPEDLQELHDDDRLARTGPMHPLAEVYGHMVDAYVRPRDLEQLVLFHLLEPARHRAANVRLRVQDPLPRVRRLHVIADLLDDRSPCSRAEAGRLLDRLLEESR